MARRNPRSCPIPERAYPIYRAGHRLIIDKSKYFCGTEHEIRHPAGEFPGAVGIVHTHPKGIWKARSFSKDDVGYAKSMSKRREGLFVLGLVLDGEARLNFFDRGKFQGGIRIPWKGDT